MESILKINEILENVIEINLMLFCYFSGKPIFVALSEEVVETSPTEGALLPICAPYAVLGG